MRVLLHFLLLLAVLFKCVCVAHRCTCVYEHASARAQVKDNLGEKVLSFYVRLMVVEIRSAKSIYLLSLPQCMLWRFHPYKWAKL